MKGFPDDSALQARRVVGDYGPLFAGVDWPAVRPPEAEQAVLPIGGTIEGRYRAWRETEEGAFVFGKFCRLAVREAQLGAARVSGKALWEQIRGAPPHPKINNDYHPLAVRDAEVRHPELRGLFEKRARTAT